SACVIFAVCVSCCISKYIVVARHLEDFQENKTTIYELSDEKQELFSKLWVIGTMYLRNLDEKGKLNISGQLAKSTINTLQTLGLMDKNGKITITPTENLRYYVSWGDNSISSDKNIFDDINYCSDYSTTYNNGSLNTGNVMHFDYYNFNWYETDYGMTYYDFPHEIAGKQAAAIYDYDTSDLDYSVDKLNVKIYDKPDGTPSCFDYKELHKSAYIESAYTYNAYYDEFSDEIVENFAMPSDMIKNINNQDYYIYYDTENQTWTKIKKSPVCKGDVSGLKIGIKPVDTILDDIINVDTVAHQEKINFINYLLKFIPFVIFSLLLMTFFIVTSGYNPEKSKYLTDDYTQNKTFVLSFGDTIWAELVIAIGVIAVLTGAVFIQEVDETLYLTSYVFADNPTIPTLLWTTALTASFSILSLAVNSIIKRFKCKSFFQTTFIRHIFNILIKICLKLLGKIQSVIKAVSELKFSKEMADTEIIAKRFLIRFVLFIFGYIMATIWENGFLLIVLFVGYAYFSLKDIIGLVKLSRQINDIYNGDYSPTEIDQNSPIYSLSEKLNNISDGIQNAVDKKIKSEKMKVDLVANVSHDLKTPLTSIISYINLLSMENDLSPVARDYVNILEQKSARLSEIVADVFDIAKATSRTDINFEMIDATILLEQVLADMANKIEASGRDIRKSVYADSTPIFADGTRLYRVLQNIIDNALKYSLDNTRIYIILNVYSENVVITVKNISSYEIKLTPEELTERFTRGDESRTTEGSGLGLSIAKSFTEACNGIFEIDIDGDVFTAKIQFPIMKN
ncbi:MAG: HAMP domain-containing histidine kinase, partial [Ruminococcus sp.]|nr:HAMP domain-containing histidine kinase [Ruminococcus sp.]